MIALARHGETPYNAQRRFQGHLPVLLTDRGREQAHELAELAATRVWASLWCSTLARARETAGIVAARIGLMPRVDDRLAETETGDWTDLTYAEVEAADPERFASYLRADADFGFPGGESFAEQSRRVAAALDEIARGPLPALVVCHRGVIRLALTMATGDESRRSAHIENAALFDLAWSPAGAS